MALHEVVIDGAVVWSDTIDGPGMFVNFPEGYRRRPESGAVELRVDGEVIAVMRTEEADAYARAEQQIAERNARIAEARAVLLAEGVM